MSCGRRGAPYEEHDVTFRLTAVLPLILVFHTFNTFNRFSTKSCTNGFVHIATLSTIQQVFNKSFNIKIIQKISFQ